MPDSEPVMTVANGAEKTVDVDALKKSVQITPPVALGSAQAGDYGASTVFFLASAADEFVPWGTAAKGRDRQLRAFIPQEPMFVSALGTVCSRNSSFSWKIEGPETPVKRYQDVLANANFGAGWADFVLRLSMDLYTQDHGAFIEVIREADSERSPVVGIATLDAQRCYPTGDPQIPVIYADRNGTFHYLKWYQVIHLLELPSANEMAPGLQYCALTRILLTAQIMRSSAVYTNEKLSGRHSRAVALFRGVSATAVADAMAQAQIVNDSRGLSRFTMPVMVSSIDPKAEVGVTVFEIASLPDGFDLKTQQQQALTLYAMGFFTDYQEFAPLPGGNLGTSAQSEILHEKARGKGPGLFMKLLGQALNFVVLPKNCEFIWDEQDQQADFDEAQTKKLRAEERSIRILSGELTPEAARQLAYDAGDLPRELLDALGQEDVTSEVTIDSDSTSDSQDEEALPDVGLLPETAPPPGAPPPPGVAQRTGEQGQQEKDQDERAGPSARLAVENELERIIEEAFGTQFADLLAQAARE